MQSNNPPQDPEQDVPTGEPENPVDSVSRPVEGETPPPVEKPAAVPPKESGFKRGARYTLGTETRFGRFMRAALRFLATVLGLFALGLLAGYLLLARPLDQQTRQLRADLETVNASLASAETDLETARQGTARLEREQQALQAELQGAQAHVLLLRAYADVAAARMQLALDQPAAAKRALETTSATLKELETSVPGADAEMVKAIYSRLELSIQEIDTNPTLAASDLDILVMQLEELEGSLFPE